jgi:CubicO group peptidase (beta-lactamase class C family)
VKFRLGSITKQFTSMLIMQQVAKGSIKLKGHITDYLPYYRQDTGSKVTISQLLSHTSGIPSYTDDPKFFADVSRNYYAVDDFVKKFCSGDLQFEPGTPESSSREPQGRAPLLAGESHWPLRITPFPAGAVPSAGGPRVLP